MITRNSNDLQDSFRKTLQDFLLFEPMLFVIKKNIENLFHAKKKFIIKSKKKSKKGKKDFLIFT